jgi:hypothetical protein
MKNSLRIAIQSALVLGFAAGAAQAQNFGPPDQRETWVDGSRTQVWKNAYGECWHSAFGPPPPPEQCGAIVRVVAPAPVVAPAVIAPPPPRPAPPPPAAAPAPAPAPYVAPREPRRDRN